MGPKRSTLSFLGRGIEPGPATRSNMPKRILALLVWSTTIALATPVAAGGLYLREFGTSSTGTASAGAPAGTDDASTALHNPAGMTRLDDHALSLGGAFLYSRVDFDPRSSPTAGSDGGQQGGFALAPSVQYVHVLTDRLRFGASILSISGAVLDPNDGWTGRFEITESNLLTLSLLPTLALRVTDWLSLGAGPAITYGRLDLDVAIPSLLPMGSEGKVSVDDADDWAATFVGGVEIQVMPDLRLGVIYTSETQLDLSGDADIAFLGMTPSLDLDLELDLAQSIRAGLRWQASEDLTLLLSGGWEDWSTLDKLPVSTAGGSAGLPLRFHDTWNLGAGAHYQVAEAWTLQAGLNYDSSPVSKSDRTAAFPIDRQFRYAIGARYDWSEFTRLGASFEYVDLGEAQIRNSRVRGSYTENDLYVLTLNVAWKKLPWGGWGSWGG